MKTANEKTQGNTLSRRHAHNALQNKLYKLTL